MEVSRAPLYFSSAPFTISQDCHHTSLQSADFIASTSPTHTPTCAYFTLPAWIIISLFFHRVTHIDQNHSEMHTKDLYFWSHFSPLETEPLGRARKAARFPYTIHVHG